MANFSSLKQAIQNYIKENGNNEITGTLLQSILLSMVTTIGDGAVNDLESDVSDINSDITDINGALTASVQFTGGSLVFKNANDTVLYSIAVSTFLDGIVARLDSGAVYAGYAAPSTTPDTLAGQKVFYVATQAGTYIHFLYNGDTPITLAKDGIYFIVSGAGADDWNAEPIQQLDDVPTPNSNNPIKSGAVLRSIIQDGSAFDLSAHNAVGGVLATYADLSAALTALNSLDDVYKQPGMSFKFVRTSDNKYVQFRLMSTSFSTIPSDWQGVDYELIYGSKNLVDNNSVFIELYNISFNNLKLANHRGGYVMYDTGIIRSPDSSAWTLYYFPCSIGDRFKVKYTSWSSTISAAYSVFNDLTIGDSSVASTIGPRGESNLEYDVTITDPNAKWFVVQEVRSDSQILQFGCTVKKAEHSNKILQQMFNSKGWTVNGDIVYDVNEIPISCNIKWNDGTLGTLVYSNFDDNVFEYTTLTVTYNNKTIVYTLIFDENGYITNETINIQ